MLIYGLREPKPPFQSWNEPLINKVKTSKGFACVCVSEKSSLMNNAQIISSCEYIKTIHAWQKK